MTNQQKLKEYKRITRGIFPNQFVFVEYKGLRIIRHDFRRK